MKIKLLLAAAVCMTVAACSGAPAPESSPAPAASTAPAPLNPVGRYEFATTVDGNPVTGGIEISGSPGAYTGQITTSITPPLPIAGVTVMGQEMVITGNTPDGPLTIRLAFTDGTAFTGGWELSGDSGSMTGRRVM